MNNPNDLISRMAAIEAYLDADPEATFTEILDSVSAVDAAPVINGRWYDKGSLSCRCSCCGCKSNKEYNYCPYCGAKMDGERRNNE